MKKWEVEFEENFHRIPDMLGINFQMTIELLQIEHRFYFVNNKLASNVILQGILTKIIVTIL